MTSSGHTAGCSPTRFSRRCESELHVSALGWASERFPAKGQQASRAGQDLGGWVQGLRPGERLGNPQSETAVHVRWAPRPPAISLPPAPVPSPCPPRLGPICLGLSPLGP